MIGRKSITLGIALALAGAAAAQSPPRQAIDFVHGCWISTDRTQFLRLLPAGDAYGGELREFGPSDQIRARVPLLLARNGSGAVIRSRESADGYVFARVDGASAWPTSFAAAAVYDGPGGRLVVAGDPTHLVIWQITRTADVGRYWFDGVRDGCD